MMSPIARAFLRPISRVALALACATVLGCSFSHSSESASDSSTDSSDSSVNSSESSSARKKDENARFDQDVERYTLAFVQAGGRQGDAFFSGLGDLARQHGVSDWESEASTWEAIGRGLARSQASTAERSAYQTAWTGGDASKQSAVAKGLSAAR